MSFTRFADFCQQSQLHPGKESAMDAIQPKFRGWDFKVEPAQCSRGRETAGAGHLLPTHVGSYKNSGCNRQIAGKQPACDLTIAATG